MRPIEGGQIGNVGVDSISLVADDKLFPQSVAPDDHRVPHERFNDLAARVLTLPKATVDQRATVNDTAQAEDQAQASLMMHV